MARLLLAAIAVVGLLSTGTSAAQVDECSRRGGVPYPPSSAPGVDVHSPVFATHATGFAMRGAGAVVDGSLRYDVVGPGGSTHVQGDKDFGASYTPPVVGRYAVTATYRELICANGDASTYADVTTPPTQFDALAGERPTASFRTSRRRTQPNAIGDAALIGFLNCPAPSRAGHADADLSVYYELGTTKPTHSSPQLHLHQAGGCDGLRRVGKRERRTRSYSLSLVRSQITVQASAPTRFRVLIEITYAGKLLRRSYGTFAPDRAGESVRRR